MPITLRAPLLPPLKEPVGIVVEEDEEEVPVNGVEFEPKLEVVEVERPELRRNAGKARLLVARWMKALTRKTDFRFQRRSRKVRKWKRGPRQCRTWQSEKAQC
jgi:hypothetical protein